MIFLLVSYIVFVASYIVLLHILYSSFYSPI